MRVSKNFLNTYANRGMDLENDINISNEHYRNIDKALIYKKPTPIKIIIQLKTKQLLVKHFSKYLLLLITMVYIKENTLILMRKKLKEKIHLF